MNFKVDPKKIKTRELIAAETSLEKTIDIMSRFAYDDSGQIVPEEDAKEMLLDMDLGEQMEVQDDFLKAVLPNLKSRR